VQVVADEHDALRFGLVDRHELLELLFEQFIAGLEAVDQAEDAHQHLLPGEAAVHLLILHQFFEGDVVLGAVGVVIAHDLHGALPFAGIDRFDQLGIVQDGAGEAFEELAVDLHAIQADLGLFDLVKRVRQDVGITFKGGNWDRRLTALFCGSASRQLEDFIVAEFFLEELVIGKEVKQLEVLLGFEVGQFGGAFPADVFEGESAGAASLDLDEIGGRKDGAHHRQVEDVLAVVAGGHHAHGDADAGFGGLVAIQKAGVPVEVVVGKVDAVLLGIRDVGGDLHRKIGVVSLRVAAHRHLVEQLGDLRGVCLADAEADRLADLSRERVEQSMVHECLAELPIGLVGEELALEIRRVEELLHLFAFLVLDHHGIALFGEQLGGDLGARVHH